MRLTIDLLGRLASNDFIAFSRDQSDQPRSAHRGGRAVNLTRRLDNVAKHSAKTHILGLVRAMEPMRAEFKAGKDPEMRTAGKGLIIVFVLAAASGCSANFSAPPQIPQSAYSGTGDLMAQCMQYASESYCERQIWGGDDG